MSIAVIFADTNALVAMLCFPPSEAKRLPLAYQVAEAVAAGECELLISDIVARELREVVKHDFPRALAELEPFLDAYGITRLEPDARLLAEAQAVCKDPDDAPILAAAVTSARLHGVRYLLSNDIETFHTLEMKDYLAAHQLTPVTLYGLLKLLGKR